MSMVFSLIESPLHPDTTDMFARLNYSNLAYNSIRKAIGALKQHKPTWVLADFLYGYGNNYAGVNISNLDVFLHSLQKYAGDARVIIFCEKPELKHAQHLAKLFVIEKIFTYPVPLSELEQMLI